MNLHMRPNVPKNDQGNLHQGTDDERHDADSESPLSVPWLSSVYVSLFLPSEQDDIVVTCDPDDYPVEYGLGRRGRRER